jgi:hypothetical protein
MGKSPNASPFANMAGFNQSFFMFKIIFHRK